MPITTQVVISNPFHGEVYLIQHYVIKFVNDLRQVVAFLQFPPPVKLTATNRYWNIVENGIKHHQTNLIHDTHLTFIFILTNLRLSLITGSKNDEIFLAEAHVMKYLRHVNVIQLYGVCTQIEPFCIIHELMTHGSLLYYLKGKILHIKFVSDLRQVGGFLHQ